MYVRRAVMADWPQVMAITRTFHAESPVHSPHPLDEAKIETIFRAGMDSPDWLVAVAVDGDELVGLMVLFRMQMFFGPAYEVGDLAFYVLPNSRGSRAAAKMLLYAELWASAKPVAVMRFGIMTGIRADATRRFFEKMGYRVTGLVVQKEGWSTA
jgi:GNAT superfamily N-acetyltransferase